MRRGAIALYHRKQIIIRYSPIQMYKEIWDDFSAHPDKYVGKDNEFFRGEEGRKIIAYWLDDHKIVDDYGRICLYVPETCPLCRAAGRSSLSACSARSARSLSSFPGHNPGSHAALSLSGPNSPPENVNDCLSTL